MQAAVDNKPGNYYVTIRRDDGKHGFLAGPFYFHQQALDMVQAVTDVAYKLDPCAPWYAYGTARLPLDIKKPGWRTAPGILNKHLGLK